MTLYPRTAEDWQEPEVQHKAWAHMTLDMWKAGEPLDPETIESALRITGDLLCVELEAA
jgi:hypothetical protein